MGKKCIVRNRKCKNPKCALKYVKKIINTHEKPKNQRQREVDFGGERERLTDLRAPNSYSHTHKKNRDIPNRGFKYEAVFGQRIFASKTKCKPTSVGASQIRGNANHANRQNQDFNFKDQMQPMQTI